MTQPVTVPATTSPASPASSSRVPKHYLGVAGPPAGGAELAPPATAPRRTVPGPVTSAAASRTPSAPATTASPSTTPTSTGAPPSCSPGLLGGLLAQLLGAGGGSLLGLLDNLLGSPLRATAQRPAATPEAACGGIDATPAPSVTSAAAGQR
jgi:hypothetical protein